MKEQSIEPHRVPAAQSPAHRVRLPGFIRDEEVGLGDLVKRLTYAIGVRPCGSCEKRAAALNRWMVVSR
jgi:hypothetical protein